MSFSSWFAQECFAAVRSHDHRCGTKEKAFSELYRGSQNDVLRLQFSRLSNVRVCKMGQIHPQGKEAGLFIETNAGERLYSEIKAMHKTWFKEHGCSYPTYLWSSFRNASKEHCAGCELAKLATLPDANTTHVALIILGSSLHRGRMDEDLDKFAQMTHIDSEPWESYRDGWPNQWHCGSCYHLRVWGCEWKNVPEWWESVVEVFRPYGYSPPIDGRAPLMRK